MKKGLFGKIVVAFVILANVIFTWRILDIFLVTSVEPVALIASWFAFTTGELGLLAFIKKKKGGNE